MTSWFDSLVTQLWFSWLDLMVDVELVQMFRSFEGHWLLLLQVKHFEQWLDALCLLDFWEVIASVFEFHSVS